MISSARSDRSLVFTWTSQNREASISLERILAETEQVVPGMFGQGQITVYLGRETVRSPKHSWLGYRFFVRTFNLMLQLSYNPAFAFQIPPESLVYVGQELFI